jgi:hypothetical protein
MFIQILDNRYYIIKLNTDEKKLWPKIIQKCYLHNYADVTVLDIASNFFNILCHEDKAYINEDKAAILWTAAIRDKAFSYSVFCDYCEALVSGGK